MKKIKRIQHLLLTKESNTIIKKIVSLKDKINEEIFKEYSPEEFEQTEKTLNKIRSCLDKKIRRDAL